MTAHGPDLHDDPFTREPPQPPQPPRGATVSSTGRVSVRLLPGLSLRFGRTKS